MIRNILMTAYMSLLIVGCGQEEAPKDKDTLTIAVKAGPVSLNPYGSNDVNSGAVRANLFDSLLERDQEGSIQPALATKWEQLSPTEILFTLRPNVKFHNGETLSVEDVKFSFELALVSPEMEQFVKSIKGVDIIDASTFKLVLNEPFAPLISILPEVEILNQKAIEVDKRDIDQDPVGTGPYKLEKWNHGQNTSLVRNEDYWRELAIIPNINMIIVPEGTARSIALETKEVDIIYEVVPVDAERIESNPDLVLIGKSTPAIEYLGINVGGPGANPIWDDIRVREAFALAIDKQGIIDSVYFGMGTLPSSFVHPNLVGYYDGIVDRPRDIKKAQALIKEAGITDDQVITLYGAEGLRPKTLEIIQANLREIGLNANIQILEWGTFLEVTAQGQSDVYIMGWVTTSGDADGSLYPLLHSTAAGGGGNRTYFANPEVDNLLDQARVEVNQKTRMQLYKEVQEILYTELPVIPVFYYVDAVAASKDIDGFIFDLGVQHRLRTVKFKS